MSAAATRSPSELPAELEPILRHLESCYPQEGCGVILRAPSGQFRVRPMRNAHAEAADRSAAEYRFELGEQLSVWTEADANAERLTCAFHSHVDAPAQFSALDRALAAPEGEPLHPGVAYLVVAVERGRATSASLYRWTGGTYAGKPLRLPAR